MDWQTILLSAVSIMLTSLVTWLSQRLITWINLKLSNTKSGKFLADAVEVVTRAVKVTYQTYVESLKEKDIFTGEAQAEALQKARDMALDQLSQDIQDYISENFGNLDVWINSMIESVIYDLKNKFAKEEIVLGEGEVIEDEGN